MIYLDAAATLPPDPEIWPYLAQFYQTLPGNPSATHEAGKKAASALRGARAWLAGLFHLPEEAVIFTSGGTESINLALKGGLKPGGRLLISGLEHAAVAQTAKELEGKGVPVRRLKHRRDGSIDEADLAAALRERPDLISIQQVNSETGVMQPVTELAAQIKAGSPQSLFHVDGVQAFGKFPCNLKGIDLYSISGHKFRALPGVGALIRTTPQPLSVQQQGGGQEFGLRSGTENLCGALSLQWAGARAINKQAENLRKVSRFKQELMGRLQQKLPQVRCFEPAMASPYILLLFFPGCLGEILLNQLSGQGVMVSTGSACNAKSKKLSPTLTALGFSPPEIKSTLRLSFHPDLLPVKPEKVAQELVLALAATSLS